ncbi:MAG: 30S ribosomal protein S6 [Proteobacteria bacterium]|nr:30S ribosomal protein S6 [Pseudomonadota bacterium]
MAQGYEILIIFHPETPDDEIENQINKTKDVISESKGEFLKANKWGQRKLVYKIKGVLKGYFLIVYFLGNPDTLKVLDGLFRYNERILRYQTIKLDKKFDFQSLQEEASPEKAEITEPEKEKEEGPENLEEKEAVEESKENKEESST